MLQKNPRLDHASASVRVCPRACAQRTAHMLLVVTDAMCACSALLWTASSLSAADFRFARVGQAHTAQRAWRMAVQGSAAANRPGRQQAIPRVRGTFNGEGGLCACALLWAMALPAACRAQGQGQGQGQGRSQQPA